MPRYQVTRTWVVEADSAPEALAKTKPEEHVDVRAERLPEKSRMDELIENYIQAAIEESWAGSDEATERKQDLEKAKAELHAEIDRLIKGH